MRRVLMVVGLLAVILPAADAQAGTFLLRTCGPSGANNAWHATPPPPGIMEVNESCQSPSPMQGPWVRDVLASSSDLTDGQGAWLVFDATPGTRIAAITYKRWLWKEAIQDLQPALSTGEGAVLETCSIQFGNDRCDVGGDGFAAVSFTGLDTDQLVVGVGCEIPPGSFGTLCPGGGTQHGYGAVIYDATVTIRDDIAPAAPAVAEQGLWSNAAWHRGTSSIAVSGADASGIKAVRIYSDGQLLAEHPATCDFTRPKPCPDASDLEVPLETTLMPDGEHELAAALVDSAGNESARVTHAVLIANAPPAPPTLTLTPTRSTSPNFTATWTPAPGHPVAIALAHVLVCYVGVCSTATTAASSIDLTAPGVGFTDVSVYLEDVAGNVSAGNLATSSFMLDPTRSPADPPVDPGGTNPAPSDDDPPAKAAALLRVALTSTSSRLRVGLRADARASGTVRVAVRWRIGDDPTRRRWSTVYHRRTSIEEGRGVLSVKRPPRGRLARVAVFYDGSSTLNTAVARRTIRLR